MYSKRDEIELDRRRVEEHRPPAVDVQVVARHEPRVAGEEALFRRRVDAAVLLAHQEPVVPVDRHRVPARPGSAASRDHHRAHARVRRRTTRTRGRVRERFARPGGAQPAAPASWPSRRSAAGRVYRVATSAAKATDTDSRATTATVLARTTTARTRPAPPGGPDRRAPAGRPSAGARERVGPPGAGSRRSGQVVQDTSQVGSGTPRRDGGDHPADDAATRARPTAMFTRNIARATDEGDAERPGSARHRSARRAARPTTKPAAADHEHRDPEDRGRWEGEQRERAGRAGGDDPRMPASADQPWRPRCRLAGHESARN